MKQAKINCTAAVVNFKNQMAMNVRHNDFSWLIDEVGFYYNRRDNWGQRIEEARKNVARYVYEKEKAFGWYIN